MARKYVPNGKPRGGKREGAGRPEGSTSALGHGEVKAIKAAGLRVPENATREQRELADEALGKIASIMRGEVDYLLAPTSLKASTHLREEICGSVKKQIEHSLSDLTDEQLNARWEALKARLATEPQEAGQTASPSESKGDDNAALGLEGEET